MTMMLIVDGVGKSRPYPRRLVDRSYRPRCTDPALDPDEIYHMDGNVLCEFRMD